MLLDVAILQLISENHLSFMQLYSVLCFLPTEKVKDARDLCVTLYFFSCQLQSTTKLYNPTNLYLLKSEGLTLCVYLI